LIEIFNRFVENHKKDIQGLSIKRKKNSAEYDSNSNEEDRKFMINLNLSTQEQTMHFEVR
jgi:hypothetical protein